MKTRAGSCHGFFIPIFFLFLLISIRVRAQTDSGPPPNPNLYPYTRFSPSLLIIIATLVTSLFFMVLFSIYIRHCTDATNTVLPGLSRRVAAAMGRGLDRTVIETFPTFSYSEVKDHKIGKGALECAVCLNEFEDNETLRLIPNCDHVFHPECIDSWLEAHVTCPVCRANLVPQSDHPPVSVPDGTNNNDEEENNDGDTTAERSSSRYDETVIQIDEDGSGEPERQGAVNRNLSFGKPNRPPRSISMRRPRKFNFGKFRSYSTGNLLVQPGEDLDRFTLRLPADVRKEVISRASLNRAKSFGTTLGVEGSSRKGVTTAGGGGENGSWTGRFYGRIERSDREVKSDRWVFFRRALSMNLRSPKMAPETGEGGGGGSSSKRGGSRTPVKMPSFKCLEPRAADETSLFSGEPPRPPV